MLSRLIDRAFSRETITGLDGTPYLSRWNLFSWKQALSIRLHHFHRPDQDRDLHNHPWKWAVGIPLCGSYSEERMLEYPNKTTHRRVEWLRPNLILREDFHSITDLHGDVWTLFITGPRVASWGFLVKGLFVPWQDYVACRGL